MAKMPAEYLIAQTKLSPLSTFKELLRWSKNIVTLAPLVGSQLQALFAIAETIVDVVERVHRDREAEIDLAKKVCGTVTIVACALDDCRASDISRLVADLTGIYNVAEIIHKVLILRSKKTLRQRFFLASTKTDDVTKLSSQLDEVLAMFQFKCAIQTRIGIQKLSDKLDILVKTEEEPEATEPLNPSAPDQDIPARIEHLSPGKRPRSPSSNLRRARNGRPRLDKTPNATEERLEPQDNITTGLATTDKAVARRRRSRGRRGGRKTLLGAQEVDASQSLGRECAKNASRPQSIHAYSSRNESPVSESSTLVEEPISMSLITYIPTQERGRSFSQSAHRCIGETVMRSALRARSLSPEVRARVTDGARRKAMYLGNWSLVSPLVLGAGHYSLGPQVQA